MSFDEVYKPINNSLKHFRKLTDAELSELNTVKEYQTVTRDMITNIKQPKKKQKSCLRV